MESHEIQTDTVPKGYFDILFGAGVALTKQSMTRLKEGGYYE